MNENIKHNSLVRLKGFMQNMRVVERGVTLVNTFRSVDGVEDVCSCIWFDVKGRLHESTFLTSMLDFVE